jgi:predicted ATPase
VIDRVSFTNFKSLRRVDADLRRFTVIVGPNGSGKTSILDGLYYLAQMAGRSSLVILSDASNLKSRNSAGDMKLALTGCFHGTSVGVQAVITYEDHAKSSIGWSATIARRWGEDETEEESVYPSSLLAAKPAKSREMAALAAELGSARKLRLDVQMLAAASYSQQETPRLGIDGEGLGSVVADIAGRSPDAFQSITEAAKQVIPALERIRTRRAQVHQREYQNIQIDDEPIQHALDRTYWGQQIVLDFKGAPDVPAPLASEGTLLVIGLLTALWTEPRPRLLLLDDIHKALHPRAQGELVAQLRKVLELDPELQIVATSHSPYLLDHFEAHEVLVTALRPDGSTACSPLTAHPDFDRWKGTTQPGELWSFLGEDWVAQERRA